ncbi:acylphosphatase [Microbulbifer yueqingensis]|uniref:D-alanine-D-alanine ligase n=1 Tax=Microbulbifer yueqingensis TaxID=658219 RepID=A0A1G9E694_9GAMM|nr:acylphosphatase [Microbulbifer yueqingensis]SDK71649.1 D-alanine-D-alanine ligase [Microbulbifer yueqingensis]
MLVKMPAAADRLFEVENDFSDSPAHHRKSNIAVSLICSEAERLGLQVKVYKGLVFEVLKDERRVGFLQNSPDNSAVYSYCAKKKDLAKLILQQGGVPVPEGAIFSDRQGARDYFESCGWPVVLKPTDRSHGTGVTTGVETHEHFDHAWEEAIKFDNKVIVERFLCGYDLRVIVIGGRAVSAYARLPASVVGDGKQTIFELVEQKNRQRLRNPSARLSPIRRFDFLLRTGRSLDEVPGRGEYVQLASVANVSAGGDAVQVIDHIDAGVLETALKAARCFPGLAQVGVDLIVHEQDSCVSAQVIEINANPTISSSVFPSYGRPVNVPRALLEFVFDESRAQPEKRSPVLAPARPYVLGVGSRRFPRDVHSQQELLFQAAYKQNLEIDEVDGQVFSVVGQNHSVMFYKGMPERTNVVSLKISRDRELVARVLQEAGLRGSGEPGQLTGLYQYRTLVIHGRVVACLYGGAHSGNVDERCHYDKVRHDVTDMVHPAFVKLACRSVESVFNPYLAGVDILAADISVSPERQRWLVIDIYCNPSLELHHFPGQGVGRDVAGSLIRSLFPQVVSGECKPRCVHALISGELQGVGYLNWVQRQAICYGLGGWVRNLDDGRVEMLLEGPPRAVDAMLVRARTGHSRAQVSRISVRDQPGTNHYGFGIKN